MTARLQQVVPVLLRLIAFIRTLGERTRPAGYVSAWEKEVRKVQRRIREDVEMIVADIQEAREQRGARLDEAGALSSQMHFLARVAGHGELMASRLEALLPNESTNNLKVI